MSGRRPSKWDLLPSDGSSSAALGEIAEATLPSGSLKALLSLLKATNKYFVELAARTASAEGALPADNRRLLDRSLERARQGLKAADEIVQDMLEEGFSFARAPSTLSPHEYESLRSTIDAAAKAVVLADQYAKGLALGGKPQAQGAARLPGSVSASSDPSAGASAGPASGLADQQHAIDFYGDVAGLQQVDDDDSEAEDEKVGAHSDRVVPQQPPDVIVSALGKTLSVVRMQHEQEKQAQERTSQGSRSFLSSSPHVRSGLEGSSAAQGSGARSKPGTMVSGSMSARKRSTAHLVTDGASSAPRTQSFIERRASSSAASAAAQQHADSMSALANAEHTERHSPHRPASAGMKPAPDVGAAHDSASVFSSIVHSAQRRGTAASLGEVVNTNQGGCMLIVQGPMGPIAVPVAEGSSSSSAPYTSARISTSHGSSTQVSAPVADTQTHASFLPASAMDRHGASRPPSFHLGAATGLGMGVHANSSPAASTIVPSMVVARANSRSPAPRPSEPRSRTTSGSWGPASGSVHAATEMMFHPWQGRSGSPAQMEGGASARERSSSRGSRGSVSDITKTGPHVSGTWTATSHMTPPSRYRPANHDDELEDECTVVGATAEMIVKSVARRHVAVRPHSGQR